MYKSHAYETLHQDRLIVAHARLRNWRLATGDDALIARLGAKALEL
jgi:hypothetical protein